MILIPWFWVNNCPSLGFFYLILLWAITVNNNRIEIGNNKVGKWNFRNVYFVEISSNPHVSKINSIRFFQLERS